MEGRGVDKRAGEEGIRGGAGMDTKPINACSAVSS